MTKAIVAALLAASSILPGVAAAQDAGRDRTQLTDQQRQARAERRAERQAGQGGERGQQQVRDRGDRGERGPRGDDRAGQRGDDGRGGDRNGGRFDGDRGRVDGRNDGGRFDGGRYDGGRYDRDGRGGWDNRGGWNGSRGGAQARWSNDWRHDGRYDWNRYRSYNRQAFRLPRYFAPGGYGYGYRRFAIGARIGAAFFGRNYWISDPWAYRLPPAYGPYRWVRYYNDAVLVDLRSGAVVDAIYGIFW